MFHKNQHFGRNCQSRPEAVGCRDGRRRQTAIWERRTDGLGSTAEDAGGRSAAISRNPCVYRFAGTSGESVDWADPRRASVRGVLDPVVYYRIRRKEGVMVSDPRCFLLIGLEPVARENGQVLEIRATVIVHVGDKGLSGRLNEIGLARFCCAAITAHVHPAAMGLRLIARRHIRVAGVDARAGDIILDPSLAVRVPAAGLTLEMIIPIDPEGAVRAPIARLRE